MHAFVDEAWHVPGLHARLPCRTSQKRLRACLRAFGRARVLGYNCPGLYLTVWPAWAIAISLTVLPSAGTSSTMTMLACTMTA